MRDRVPSTEPLQVRDWRDMFTVFTDALLEGKQRTIHEPDRWQPILEQFQKHPKAVIDGFLSDIKTPPQPRPRSMNLELEAIFDEDKLSALETLLYAQLPGTIIAKVPFQRSFMDAARIMDAFPPTESIKCLRDTWRTKLFAKAIEENVRSFYAVPSHEHITMEVVDAGCGAFPFMGIYAALCAKEIGKKVQVTCLELSPASAIIAQTLVETMGLSDVVKVIATDATGYRPQKKFDLIISETMNSGFVSEDLQSIATALMNDAHPDSVTIPSQVDILGAMIPHADYQFAPECVYIYNSPVPYLRLRPEQWTMLATYKPGDTIQTISGTLQDSALVGRRAAVVVTSRVHFPGTTQPLDIYESLITVPQVVARGAEYLPDVVIPRKKGVRLSYPVGRFYQVKVEE